MDIRNVAWAAGIYEGEGCFAGSNGNKYIHVTQKDRWLCNKLQSLFGGTVKFYGTHYRWFLYSKQARGFLLTIFSFLSPRRREALLDDKEFFRHMMCKKGLHEYNEYNIRTEMVRNRGIRKYCRLCRIEKGIRK